jgi:hypothetical protein
MDPTPSAILDRLLLSPYLEWSTGLYVIGRLPGQPRAYEGVVLGTHTPVVDGVADKDGTMLVVAWSSDGRIEGRTLPAKACRVDIFNEGNRGHLISIARKAWRDRWLSTARTPTGKWVVMFGSPSLSTTASPGLALGKPTLLLAPNRDAENRGPFVDEDEGFALALCIIAAPAQTE